ncbi:MAG: Hpt domain-containing protein [Treponema sp.]|jgi:HPt (histidine-containing phosphotransfer) domain-containing protein|nr:Hpt domain-containing protein [Treponema sp.]
MTDDVVYVNTVEGQKRVLNNAKLYHRLLAKFKAENNLNDLTAALNEGDYEKAQAAAHTIKGIAANLSFPELYKQSQDVETQINGRSVASGTMDALSACFTATLEAIDKVLKNA